ncbi:FMN reductase [Leifsonia sp. Leaf264]|uniref:FMN reductase n=1 Tax=Leifsonia sp. Leaf264 TaxID=1736314 RepID=UPI0006F9C854|nr:FMN reductase [Leifsonia sp. Leaf264]KQO99637.1 NADPH-dependent FMN reductase [Leifsonia sp. Leaf264]
MTAKKLTVLAAGLSQPSSTRLLADRLTDAVVSRLRQVHGVDVEVSVVELRDVAKDVTNNLITGFPSPKLESVIEQVTHADGLIVATPIFSGSYSGMFKSFIDVLDPKSLDGMPVLLGATGGTARHSLAIEHALRPLFSYLHAVAVPTGVYAAAEDWGSATDSVGALTSRIERAAGELAALVAVSDRSQQIRDPFALDSSFSVTGGFSAA